MWSSRGEIGVAGATENAKMLVKGSDVVEGDIGARSSENLGW